MTRLGRSLALAGALFLPAAGRAEEAGAFSAPSVALGGALFASRGIQAYAENPAEIAAQQGTWIEAGTQAMLGGLNRHQLAAAGSFGEVGSFGLKLSTLEYGDFDSYGEDGSSLGTVQARDLELGLELGRRFGGSGLGLSAEIERQDFGAASDWVFQAALGGTWQVFHRLDLGLSVRGQPGMPDSGGLAFGTRVDGSYLLRGLAAYATLRAEEEAQGSRSYAHYGLEAGVGPHVMLRVGQRRSLASPGGESSECNSLGGGVNVGALRLDYAWTTASGIGQTHSLGLAWALGSQPKPMARVEPGPATTDPPLPPAAQEPSPRIQEKRLVRTLSPEHLEGRKLEAEGKLVAALKAYRKGALADPGDLPSWEAMARLYQRLGKPDFADQCLKQVAQLGSGMIR